MGLLIRVHRHADVQPSGHLLALGEHTVRMDGIQLLTHGSRREKESGEEPQIARIRSASAAHRLGKGTRVSSLLLDSETCHVW